MQQAFDYDYVIIGSGFGGSVSALRLSEKGYRVLVIEKGKEWQSDDFPKTNWNLKRWLWMPLFRFFGFFKLTFFRHITVLSGVGVGGGSLVYANTLPIPKDEFFTAESWGYLCDWKTELMPFYKTARQMLGTARNPRTENGDRVLQEISQDLHKEQDFELTDVAVFFGEAGEPVADPYFNGRGPERSGCTFCGGCMTGCRHNAKNTLDKNYLYLARQQGAELIAEHMVHTVEPMGASDGSAGYRIRYKPATRLFGKNKSVSAAGVVFAGGVLGSLPLLLKLKKTTLPKLSNLLGNGIRTNSESLLGVTTFDKETVFSDGVAISSILHTDEHSHIEPVRYASGSGFWRVMLMPMVTGSNLFKRLVHLFADLLRHPLKNLRVFFVWDFAKRTQILLFMQTLSSTLKFSHGRFGLTSSMEAGPAPTAFIPEAQDLANRFAQKVNGKPVALLTETIVGIPTTAHILGGCGMGTDVDNGVIDRDHHLFGYKNLLVCDGSAISANPGVNPSLTITALTERAMAKIEPKQKDL